jgi:uridine kinase
MFSAERTRECLLAHLASYPQLQTEDIFKFLHQSTLGCEHLVASAEAAAEYIRREAEGVLPDAPAAIERLDGDFCRVPLAFLREGLSPETLSRLFFLSSSIEGEGSPALAERLGVARAMVAEGLLPVSLPEFDEKLAAWRTLGYPAVHHSETFRTVYRPAYRVIATELARLLPLLARIDAQRAKGRVILALEGGSASGKTTLAAQLGKIYGCTVLHMDDFFLRPEQRTPERFAEIGGNVDRERFLAEVLLPLSRGERIAYRRFDCTTQALLPAVSIDPAPLTVVEGAYSMHPELAPYYTFSVFLENSPEEQRARILRRNTPEHAVRFFNEWIPLEHRYFEGMRVRERCDLLLATED